jgi:hypothetical protein
MKGPAHGVEQLLNEAASAHNKGALDLAALL